MINIKSKHLSAIVIALLLVLSLVSAVKFATDNEDFFDVYSIFNVSNLTAGTVTISNNLTVVGNISADFFSGSGAFLNDLQLNTTLNGTIDGSDVVNPLWLNTTGGNLTGNLNMDNNNISAVDFGRFNFIENAFNITSTFFNGMFNWTTVGSFLSFDGATLTLDQAGINGTIRLIVDESNSTDQLDALNTTSGITKLIDDIYVNVTGDDMTGDLNIFGELNSSSAEVQNNLSIGNLTFNQNPAVEMFLNGSDCVFIKGITKNLIIC